MGYIAPVSYSVMAPVNFRANDNNVAAQNVSTPIDNKKTQKGVKKDNSSQLMLSLAALGSVALASTYIYKHHNLSKALKEAETKAKELQEKLNEAENKLKNIKNSTHTNDSKQINNSSGSQASDIVSAGEKSNSSSGTKRKKNKSRKNNNNQNRPPITENNKDLVPDLQPTTPIQVKHTKTNQEQVINNIETSNLAHSERNLVEDAKRNVSSQKDVAEYRQSIAYVKPNKEEKNVIANINSEARQASAEAHRIENNIDSQTREALNQARAGMKEPNHQLNGTFFNDEAEFVIKDGKVQKIITKDGREITDELKIAKHMDKRNIEIENLQSSRAPKGGEIKGGEPKEKPAVKTETNQVEAPKPEQARAPRQKLTEAEIKAAEERFEKVLEDTYSQSEAIVDTIVREYTSSSHSLSNFEEDIVNAFVREINSKLGNSYLERSIKYSYNLSRGMSENEIIDKLRRFGLLDDMQRVNETINVNGENIKLLFKGVDFDVAADGRLLQKCKNGYDISPFLRDDMVQELKNSNEIQEQKRIIENARSAEQQTRQRKRQRKQIFA